MVRIEGSLMARVGGRDSVSTRGFQVRVRVRGMQT
jgi:hypothetical protein